MIGNTSKKSSRRSAAKTARKRTKRTTAAERATARLEVSAGGIVYKRTPQGVRLALIHDPYGRWTFAKGHQEEGEDLADTALRETREEMGLGRLKLIKPLGQVEVWFRDRYRPDSQGELIHKHIHYFLFEAPARAKGQPQKKEKIREMVWVTPRRAQRLNGYPDLLPLLGQALGHLGIKLSPLPVKPQAPRSPAKRSAKAKTTPRCNARRQRPARSASRPSSIKSKRK